MVMSTYAELQAAIIERSHRTNLADKIPGFIRNAELEINRKLTIFPKEVETPLALAGGSRFIDLPADFDSPIAAWLAPRSELVFTTAAQLPVSTSPGAPTYWAIDGNRIAFECPADQPYTVALRYLQTVFLSDANPTNDVFARAPDLYFYGALMELADFAKDDRSLALYAQRFRALMRSVAADAARSKAVQLQTELAAALTLSGGSRRNFRGY